MQQNTVNPVQNARLRLGFTLRGLAKQCAARGAPVDNSQLSKIERGKNTPRPKLRAVLAEILGLDITDLQARSD